MFVLNHVTAQPKMDDVVNMLNTNNIENIVKYFDNVVDITLDNNQSTYSKSQAEMVIRNFFNKNDVSGFKIILNGNSSDDQAFYLIGDMKTNGHGQYKVYLFFKIKGKEHLLQEMKIEHKK
jgi:Asp-tRNA(Asn)/Glu-tRNA(Gln) amidotransferase C subunit